MTRYLRLVLAVVFLCAPSALAQPRPIGISESVVHSPDGDQDQPDIASMGPDDFIVVWRGEDEIIDGNYYGGSQIDVSPAAASRPAVGSDAAGNFVVAWHVSGSDVYARRYSPGTPPTPLSAAFLVNGDGSQPSVGSFGAGSFAVVWERSGDGTDVYGQLYSSSGNPIGTEFRVNTVTTSDQAGASVAGTPSGGFVVVWQDRSGLDGDGYGIVGQRYSSTGSPIGPNIVINTHFTGLQKWPSVAADEVGNFVVVWSSDGQDGSGYGVFGQRFSVAGIAQGPLFRVNSYTTSHQFTSQSRSVSYDRGNNFVVAWTASGQDGSGRGVFGQFYDSAGAPWGASFKVNNFTPGDQDEPAVTGMRDGSFVVSYQSYGQDTSGTGVFVKFYCVHGDATGDGVVGVNDVFYLINHLFAAGPQPVGKCGDANADSTYSVADVFYLINYLFAAGPAPL